MLSEKGWQVDAGKTLRLPIDGDSPGIERILPIMRTDIVLSNSQLDRRVVIDTKFNEIVTRGHYRDETIRSGYVYQFYAYLRSQEERRGPLARNASGLLLHHVGDMVNESVVIQNHEIRFATVDLVAPARDQAAVDQDCY